MSRSVTGWVVRPSSQDPLLPGQSDDGVEGRVADKRKIHRVSLGRVKHRRAGIGERLDPLVAPCPSGRFLPIERGLVKPHRASDGLGAPAADDIAPTPLESPTLGATMGDRRLPIGVASAAASPARGQGLAVTRTSRDFRVHRPTNAQARSPNVIRYRKASHQVSMTPSTEDF